MANTEQTFDFEAALNELGKLVEDMEQGKGSLEQSLSQFERGITLTKQCQTALTEAEQKVQILLQKGSEQNLAPFEDK